MKAAIIKNGFVDNVIVLSAAVDVELFNAILCNDDVSIGWGYDGSIFSPPLIMKTLDDLKDVKKTDITKAATDAEYGGFVSEALGSLHYYNSDPKAQSDLIGIVAVSGNQAIKCSTDNNEWEYKIHTPEERQILLDDGATQRFAIAYKKEQLLVQIINATLDNINNVIWV